MNHAYSADHAYLKLLKQLVNTARTVKPRGMNTREIISYTSVINMEYPVITMKSRKLSHKFRYAEAAWILSGSNRVNDIAPYCEAISQFSDDGYTFYGAYGPKFVDQVGYVIKTLQRDRDSRQAVITIWRENPHKSKDIPCTVSWQFLIREGMMHLVVNMRSSDAWLGWPYDVFNQAMTAAYVALEVDQRLELGPLFLTCGSQHLYATNFAAAKDVIAASDMRPILPFKLNRFVSGQHLIDTLWSNANAESPVYHIRT